MRGRFTQGALLMMIMLLVTIIVLTTFGSQLFAAGKTYADEGTCDENIQKSIEARLGGFSAPIKINCPTLQHDFAEKSNDVVAQVSDGLVKCWKRWHEGEEELFEKKGAVYCDICSVFATSKTPVTLVGFKKTLAQRTLPVTAIPVATYIQSTTQLDDGTQRKNPAPVPDEFTTDKDYAVVFRYIRSPGASYNWVAELQFVPHTNAELKKLGCAELPVGQVFPSG
jgi:hypothetical protein